MGPTCSTGQAMTRTSVAAGRRGMRKPVTPVIIEAALNGVTAMAREPHVPRTPAELAADTVRYLADRTILIEKDRAVSALLLADGSAKAFFKVRSKTCSSDTSVPTPPDNRDE